MSQFKEDLIKAKMDAFKKAEMMPIEKTREELKDDDPIVLEAEATAEAVKNFLINQKFTIKEMKAAVKLDQLKTTDNIKANVAVNTLLGEWGPVLSILEKLDGVIKTLTGQSLLKVNELKKAMQKAIQPVTEGGAETPALNLREDGSQQGGTLTGTGYAIVGPEASSVDNVDTEGIDYTDTEGEFTDVGLVPDKINDEYEQLENIGGKVT